MRYCSSCGQKLSRRIPPGDHLERYICDDCGAIHYQNPKIVAGCLPLWEHKILLCRRAIEPRIGLWTLPAGFMENGESVEQAAQRETLEEALARVEITSFYTMVSLPHINQVHIMFLGNMVDENFGAGEESLEVRLLDPSEIPWKGLAFASIDYTLRRYVEDSRTGVFAPHISCIDRRPAADGILVL